MSFYYNDDQRPAEAVSMPKAVVVNLNAWSAPTTVGCWLAHHNMHTFHADQHAQRRRFSASGCESSDIGTGLLDIDC